MAVRHGPRRPGQRPQAHLLVTEELAQADPTRNNVERPGWLDDRQLHLHENLGQVDLAAECGVNRGRGLPAVHDLQVAKRLEH